MALLGSLMVTLGPHRNNTAATEWEFMAISADSFVQIVQKSCIVRLGAQEFGKTFHTRLVKFEPRVGIWPDDLQLQSRALDGMAAIYHLKRLATGPHLG